MDNMGVTDEHFAPNQTMNFALVITNTGNATVNTVSVKDIFPQFVTFAGGGGNYDAKTNTLALSLADLKPGESRTVIVSGKVVSADKLPTKNSVTCVINQAKATTDSQTVSDNAQLCIEKTTPETTKGGLPVFPSTTAKKSPSTGPEMAYLLGLIPMGSLGYLLRRRTQMN